MTGVFVSKGMGFRIPAGALRISIGPDGQPSMSLDRVEVSLDFWDHWLEVARQQAIDSVGFNKEIMPARAVDDEGRVGELFGQMLRASMTCMGALGFSLDALYSSVRERMPSEVLSGIGSSTAARHQFVYETLRRSARLSNDHAKLVRSAVKQVFKFRDWAVHPPGGWSEPVLHPDLNTSMAAGYVAFRAANAVTAYVLGRRAIELVLTNARPAFRDLKDWADGAVTRMPLELPAELVTVRWDGEGGSGAEAGPATP